MKRIILNILRKIGYDLKINKINYNAELYRKLYGESSVVNRRFYNIGAGSFYHPCWTNVDYKSDWYSSNDKETESGIEYDLFSCGPVPVESDTANVVYTSHTVEHINNDAAQNMFNEAYRMLNKGGVFRVTTPNTELEFRALSDDDRDYFYWIDTYSIPAEQKRVKYKIPLNQASTAQIFLAHFATSVSTLHEDGEEKRIDDEELMSLFARMELPDALDYCASRCSIEKQKKYPGNHMNWWTFDKLSSMLKTAGFTNVYLSGYGQSRCPILRDVNFFDNTHPKISLYVEAIK